MRVWNVFDMLLLNRKERRRKTVSRISVWVKEPALTQMCCTGEYTIHKCTMYPQCGTAGMSWPTGPEYVHYEQSLHYIQSVHYVHFDNSVHSVHYIH